MKINAQNLDEVLKKIKKKQGIQNPIFRLPDPKRPEDHPRFDVNPGEERVLSPEAELKKCKKAQVTLACKRCGWRTWGTWQGFKMLLNCHALMCKNCLGRHFKKIKFVDLTRVNRRNMVAVRLEGEQFASMQEGEMIDKKKVFKDIKDNKKYLD